MCFLCLFVSLCCRWSVGFRFVVKCVAVFCFWISEICGMMLAWYFNKALNCALMIAVPLIASAKD
jgi:hypothetical protein